MQRRDFLGKIGVAPIAVLVAGSVPGFEACSFSSVYSDILKYVPLGVSAFQAVLSILTGQGIVSLTANSAIAAAVNLVKAGFADLQTFVTDYTNAAAAAQPGLLGKVSAGLQTVEQDIQSFWASLAIPDASLSQTISGLLGVIISTLMGFATQLPAPAASANVAIARGIVVPAKKRSLRQFKGDFNALLTSGGYAHLALK